jgi:hypothetical protein
MPRRPVVALILALFAGHAAAEPRAEHIGSWTWETGVPGLYGFSAIELSQDGTRFTVMGDGAQIVRGLVHREDGRIDGLRQWKFTTLHNTQGAALDEPDRDSEGLAIAPDGTAYVSFERRHRVWSYPDIEGPARPLPLHRAFGSFPDNAGLESLAVDQDGTLYALPERSGGLTEPFPVFRYKDGTWDVPFTIGRRGEFLPVGADFGPDGLFYLLERRFLGVFGLQSRVRRFAIDGDTIGQEQTLFETLPRTHDNLEGLAVWRDEDGFIRLTMISDDNGRAPLQRTEFVEYRVLP